MVVDLADTYLQISFYHLVKMYAIVWCVPVLTAMIGRHCTEIWMSNESCRQTHGHCLLFGTSDTLLQMSYICYTDTVFWWWFYPSDRLSTLHISPEYSPPLVILQFCALVEVIQSVNCSTVECIFSR